MAKDDLKKLEEDVIDYFKELEESFAFPLNVDYCFLSNSKQKKLIKISKIPDPYSVLLTGDLLVTINTDYYDAFDEKNKRILFETEIDKIEIDYQKGTIKVGTPKINTSSGIIKKFTIESVENAVKLEEEFEKQKKDRENNKK